MSRRKLVISALTIKYVGKKVDLYWLYIIAFSKTRVFCVNKPVVPKEILEQRASPSTTPKINSNEKEGYSSKV